MAVQYRSILSKSTMMRYQGVLILCATLVPIHFHAVSMPSSNTRGAKGWIPSLQWDLLLSLLGGHTVICSNGRLTNASQSGD